ncbi:hypothetical protein AB6805_21725 [Chitinophaga sp. RCC_12]|uniref:hypothetical protein n=1 Tax=Chitinophaga sp. RCC_12 TaxID=3239226 RepID=UPI003524752C
MEKQASKQSTPDKQVSGGFSSHANTQSTAAQNSREEEDLDSGLTADEKADEEIEDTDPPLDENDLEENDLSDEEADNIEWDEDKESGS